MFAVALVCLVLGALALAPSEALACAVCFQSKNDASRMAFIVTTAVLTGLPLGMFAAFAFWLRRRFKRTAREHARLVHASETAPL